VRPPVSPPRLAGLVALGDAFLCRVVRWRVDDSSGVLECARAGQPMIFACRHGELWPLLWVVRDLDVSVLTSRSGDGELLARILERQGFATLRGSSSSRAITAGRGALRVLRQGGRLGLAVDGPRGPRGMVQNGVLRVAQRADVPIVALRRTGGRPWVAPGSWDRFEIPRPGDRLSLRVSAPLHVGPAEAGIEAAGERLAELLGGTRPASGPKADPGGTAAWSRAGADAG